MRESGFDAVLQWYVKKGGLVIGESAGAIALGRNILTVRKSIDESITGAHGLDMLSGYSIFPHYAPELLFRLQAFWSAKRAPIIGIPEDSGVLRIICECS
jgi:peptidase E